MVNKRERGRMFTLRGVASLLPYVKKKKLKSYTNIYVLPEKRSQFRKKVRRNYYLL
jgi:hypothetical protein